MQVTETQTEGLKRQLQITIPAGEIESKVAERLADLGQRVKLPGFRPGRIPPQVLRQRYGASVMSEVLEQTVNDSTQQAMNDRGLRPALQPRVEIVAFDQGKDLEYKVDVEVLPEVPATDFASLEFERLVVPVPEESVEEAIGRLRANQRKPLPVDPPRPAQDGDLVTFDFAGTVDGKAHDGMKAEGFKLELGSGRFIPGFEGQMVGASAGETRTVTVTFPEDYPVEEIKGKEAVFEVTVHSVEALHEPALDEDFAKSLGMESVEQLRERVRQQLEGEHGQLSRSVMKRKVLDKLAEVHDFAVPPGMVEMEFKAIWDQIEKDKAADRLDPEDKDKSDEELQAEYRRIAERRVRLGLLLAEIGRSNNVEVSQEEITQGVMAEVRRFPGQEKQVIEYFQNTPAAVAQVRAPIFEQKVIDWIVEQAKVTERTLSLEELNREADAPAAA